MSYQASALQLVLFPLSRMPSPPGQLGEGTAQVNTFSPEPFLKVLTTDCSLTSG